MKFKLDEKHILAEKRHLVERYILTEETAEEAIRTTIDKALTKIKEVKDKVNSFKVDTVTNAKTAAELQDLIDQAVLTNDPAIAQAKAKEYVTKVEVMFPGNKINLYPEIKREFTEVQKLANVPTLKDSQKNDLTKVLKLTQAALIAPSSEEAKLGGTLTSDDKGKAKTIEQLDKVRDNLNLLRNNIESLTGTTAEAAKNKDAIQTLIDELPEARAITQASYETIKDACTKFYTAIGGYLSDINNEAEKEKHSKEKAAERNEASKINWAVYYKSCKTGPDFDKFWNGDSEFTSTDPEEQAAKRAGYYKAEWDDKAELVKSFAGAFTTELKTYGWDAISNPFVHYLKGTDATGTKVVIDSFKLTPEIYVVLHNAVSNRTLLTDDLFGKGTLGKTNLIFFSQLFEFDAGTVKNLLTLQQKLIANWNKVTDEKVKAAKIETALLNVFFKPGDPYARTITGPGGARALKEENVIRQLIDQLTGGASEEKKMTNAEIDNIVASVSLANCNKLIAYLVYMMSSKFKDIVRTVDKNATPPGSILQIAENTKLTFNDMANFSDNVLQLNNKAYSKEQYQYLLVELAKKVGIYNKK